MKLRTWMTVGIALMAGDAKASIHNHLTLDLLPIGFSERNSASAGAGLAYDRIHDELHSSYELSAEFLTPFDSHQYTDVIVGGGFFTAITPAFSVGARLGAVVNHPGPASAFAALGLRLPALHPEDKQFFGFFFEEIDLGVATGGANYGVLRLGMLLL